MSHTKQNCYFSCTIKSRSLADYLFCTRPRHAHKSHFLPAGQRSNRYRRVRKSKDSKKCQCHDSIYIGTVRVQLHACSTEYIIWLRWRYIHCTRWYREKIVLCSAYIAQTAFTPCYYINRYYCTIFSTILYLFLETVATVLYYCTIVDLQTSFWPV